MSFNLRLVFPTATPSFSSLTGGVPMDIERIMETLGQSGVTALLKLDHERLAEGGKPWTFALSGPALGHGNFIRVDTVGMDDCLHQGLKMLRREPGDWQWVDAFL